jgi:hypothetical protein
MDSKKYIGMDVHKESISIAVMNGTGKIGMECVMETKTSTILQFIDGLRGEVHVTFEEGTSAAWLYDLLKPHVTKLVVCDPRKNASMREGNQSDNIDTRRLAELLRLNHLSQTSENREPVPDFTRSQIEFEKGRLQLRIEGNQTKNEEPILLPLPLELNETLKKLPRNVKLFDARNLRKSFQASCVKVGLGVETGPKVWQYKGLLLHDLRRSGVRNLIRSGVPRRIAMKISGHLTESTFERYNIVDSTDLHEAMAKVEKYFDGNLMAVEENQQQVNQQVVSFQSKPR